MPLSKVRQNLVFSESVCLPIVPGNGCNDPEQWLTVAPYILIITENNRGYFLPFFQLKYGAKDILQDI